MTAPTEGRKFDEGKARFELIPAGPLTELAQLFGMGAAKYGSRNWERGIAFGRLFAAMQRHAWAWWRGERNDPEDGQHHLASVAWCALCLMELERTHPELDDRPDLPGAPGERDRRPEQGPYSAPFATTVKAADQDGASTERQLGRPASVAGAPDRPRWFGRFDSSTSRVLELSLRRALSLGHNYIAPEHVLLALLDHPSKALDALRAMPCDEDTLRRRIARIQQTEET